MYIKLRKVSDLIWEIPKEPPMRVPARIYASEILLKKMQEDKTLEQARNVATLPGIQKWMIVMPDGHQGYGFPIGGVAAFDLNEGIITPGGIGFDINCLPGNTEVLTDLGFRIKIKDLIPLLNEVELRTKEKRSRILFISERPSDEFIIKIKTETGRELELSFDHPVLTKEGWKLAKELKVGEYIAVYPFEGVEFEKPKEKVILTEKDFERYDPQIIKYLKERKLLPLKSNDLRIGILARILGYLIGDGCITRIITEERGKKRERYIVWFYGEKEGLEELRRDLEKLSIKASRIYERKRKIKIKSPWGYEYETEGKEYSIKITSKAFALLLIKLGAPVGEKTKAEFRIPEWLKESPKWVKANFLAGLFGSDGSKPIVKGKTALQISLTFVKVKELEENLVKFLEEIKEILKEFGIESEIYKVKEYDGKVMYRLYLKSEKDVYKFLTEIGYAYSLKQREGLVVAEYLRRKIVNREERKEAKLVAIGLYPRKSVKEIAEMLNVNQRLIERAVYENILETRISEYFETFEEFKEKYVENGIIYDRIKEIKIVKSNYNKLYDIGLESYHNFVANGVVVHNCGVRVIRTNLRVEDVKPKLMELVNEIFRNVPAGVGETGKVHLSFSELDKVLQEGAKWAVENGYGWEDDLGRIESYGHLEDADPDAVSVTAKRRGAPQLGTLGSGNHFLEIQVVDKIYNPEVAKAFGIEEGGQVVVMVHTGSRGLGHQVASDYIREFERRFRDIVRKLPDRELVYAPWGTKEAERYWGAMCAAANYAWANRQMITHWVRESFEKVFRTSADQLGMEIVYDVAHNIAKIEEHKVNGQKKKVIVHRKGATRAFPPGHPELISRYRKVGQPIIIPGSMGTASYILVGTEKAMEISFGSTAHGAGRQLSRAEAKRRYRYQEVINRMRQQGIVVKSATRDGVVEEVPEAYKNVDEVVRVSHELGIGKLVVRLRPIAVIKG